MITRINHDIRKSLELPFEEYILADVVKQMKKPVAASEIAEEVAMKPEEVAMILFSLCDRGYIEKGKRSGKFSVTSLWKNATKEQKQEKEVNPIINMMRLALISEDRKFPQTDYYWDGGRDAIIAEALAAKLAHSFRSRYGEDPDHEEIVHSFCILLDNLPEWNRENFSLASINTGYNGIINKIKATFQKASKPKNNQRGSSNSIDDALDLMT